MLGAVPCTFLPEGQHLEAQLVPCSLRDTGSGVPAQALARRGPLSRCRFDGLRCYKIAMQKPIEGVH